MTLLETAAVAFAMFSAVPVPQPVWNEKNMRYALCAFPLVGVVCGLAWWGWAALAARLSFPLLLRAAGLCLAPVLVTGGIHLDGYADTCDALASCAAPEKKQEILKDPHCGAFAVIRLCTYFTAYLGLCAAVDCTPRAVLCMGLGFVLERALSGYAIAAFPLAKNTGLAHTFATGADRTAVRRALLVLCALAAAGMAAAGLRPVVAVYSSFLQRAYDQVLHDVCIQNLPVLFAVDRAGLVGSDGETHQGIFDYSFLTSIPNMSVMAPKNLWELRAMLDFAMDYNSPLAVRYPRGEAYRGLKEFRQPISYGVGEILYEEEDIALLAVGSMVSTGEHVRQKLKAEGYRCSLANGRFVKPFDRKMVSRLAKNHRLIVTMEENVLQGGYGLAVTAFIHENYPEVKVLNIAIPDAYVEHGNVSILREGLGIDSDSIIRTMKTGGYIGRETLGIRPVLNRKEA